MASRDGQFLEFILEFAMESTQENIDLLGKYVKAVKVRDAARKEAEIKDKERRAAWREFYVASEALEKIAYDAGLLGSDVDAPPMAPKKKRKLEFKDVKE